MLDELLTATGVLEWIAVVVSALVTVVAVVALSIFAARHEAQLES
jgi:hypothetical protein